MDSLKVKRSSMGLILNVVFSSQRCRKNTKGTIDETWANGIALGKTYVPSIDSN
jgi:hypothetical protein